MKHETAEKVLPLLMEASARVNEAIARVFEEEDAESAHRFRRIGGQVMGEIYLELMRPIHEEFPDLVPEELRSPITGR
jgi:hypothetical protein